MVMYLLLFFNSVFFFIISILEMEEMEEEEEELVGYRIRCLCVKKFNWFKMSVV